MNEYLESIGKSAKKAQTVMNTVTTEKKNDVLCKVAEAIINSTEDLIKANELDVAVSRNNGVKESLIDRLTLTEDRIKAMAEGLVQISELEDPIGEELEEFTRPNGLNIHKVRVPVGVIGIIYESRPNVTLDAFGLCFKSSNVSVLRGGKDAINSNKAIVKVIKDTLENCGLPKDCVILIEKTEREIATEFMKLNKYIDLLIPRGGASLIRSVVENATIPVIETGTGNCHVYVDESANLDMAVNIILNAKTQRMGVCNACESLLVHEKIADKAIPAIYEALTGKAVEIRAGEKAFAICPTLNMEKATEEDYGTEYLGPIISLQVVGSVEEAIEHVNTYTTHHSECIITENKQNADKFLNEIDAACVYVNASTRFTDGFEFGFGAEIGISTQKLHARGPMGLKELTSYKYKIYGDGQIRG
ncbi:MAG: glutamate-5-semialdehyde dehydrogenase [Lachnospiraceae bacterium]|nr:glutamate-5-semialdehyde dehydrogenase [Lachnospiraceae bacterium]